jgi:hypothetical protein
LQAEENQRQHEAREPVREGGEAHSFGPHPHGEYFRYGKPSWREWERMNEREIQTGVVGGVSVYQYTHLSVSISVYSLECQYISILT